MEIIITSIITGVTTLAGVYIGASIYRAGGLQQPVLPLISMGKTQDKPAESVAQEWDKTG